MKSFLTIVKTDKSNIITELSLEKNHNKPLKTKSNRII